MGNKHSQTPSSVADGDANASQAKKSYFKILKENYQAVVHAIIRPPRSIYELHELGPTRFRFCTKSIERQDFEIPNPRQLMIRCSLWQPVSGDRMNDVLPCVIYLHGNSSSRLESLSALSLVLSLGATMLAVDLTGSGVSDGDYVSLGYYEKDDLQCVIEYLRSAGRTSTIALWGRSMGATTSLLYAERDPSIAGMVLDSAFSDLVLLAEEMVDRGRQMGYFVPGFLFKLALRFIRASVQKSAGFDIKLIAPIESADRCFIPAMFVAAEGDEFVPKHHSQAIYDKYGGDKNIVFVEGDHNSARPRFLYDSISIFLINVLQIPEHWISPEGQNFIRRLPWSSQSLYSGGDVYDLDRIVSLSLMDDFGDDVAALESDLAMQQEVQARLFSMFSSQGESSRVSNEKGSEGGSRAQKEIFSSSSNKKYSAVEVRNESATNGNTVKDMLMYQNSSESAFSDSSYIEEGILETLRLKDEAKRKLMGLKEPATIPSMPMSFPLADMERHSTFFNAFGEDDDVSDCGSAGHGRSGQQKQGGTAKMLMEASDDDDEEVNEEEGSVDDVDLNASHHSFERSGMLERNKATVKVNKHSANQSPTIIKHDQESPYFTESKKRLDIATAPLAVFPTAMAKKGEAIDRDAPDWGVQKHSTFFRAFGEEGVVESSPSAATEVESIRYVDAAYQSDSVDTEPLPSEKKKRKKHSTFFKAFGSSGKG